MSTDPKPISMVSELPPEMQQSIEQMKDNVIIALVKRSGGRLVIPIREIDAATGPLTMTLDDGNFIFAMETIN